MLHYFLRRLLLLGAPAALVAVEIFHPTHFSQNVFYGLMPHLDQWMLVHILQLPLFSFIGLGLFTVLKGIHHPVATVARMATWLFIVYYAAFDSIAGLGTGLLIRHGLALPPEQQAIAAKLAQEYFLDPYLGGMHSWMSEFASLAWLVAAWATAWVLYWAKKPLVTVCLIAVAGAVLWISHAYPYGPVAFSCLFVAYAWLEFTPSRQAKSTV